MYVCSLLIDQISRVLPEITKDEISKNIVRAHRVHSKGTSSNGSPSYLVVKMVSWEFSEKVKSAFLQENQKGRSQVRFCDVFKVTHAPPKPSLETPV